MGKDLLNGLITALSMYSILPMPQLAWNKNTMKYAMCFFPLIGGVIGGAVWLWTLLCQALSLSGFLFATVLVLLPIVLSGAIHLDGLIDTGDAIYSRLEKERKLEILKDPHVGAFGVILCGGYLLLSFGLAGEFYGDTTLLPLLCLGYLLSRGYSALSIVSFQTAKSSGLAHLFSDNADKKVVRITSLLYVLLAMAGMVWVSPFVGGVAAALSALWFWRFQRMCYRKFGGLTGDLCGYLLCITELIILLTAAIGVRL